MFDNIAEEPWPFCDACTNCETCNAAAEADEESECLICGNCEPCNAKRLVDGEKIKEVLKRFIEGT